MLVRATAPPLLPGRPRAASRCLRLQRRAGRTVRVRPSRPTRTACRIPATGSWHNVSASALRIALYSRGGAVASDRVPFAAARTEAGQQAGAALGRAFRSAEQNESARRARRDTGERWGWNRDVPSLPVRQADEWREGTASAARGPPAPERLQTALSPCA